MSMQKVIHETNENSNIVMAILDESTSLWFFTYTVFSGDEPQFTITASSLSLQQACTQVREALVRVESDYETGKLCLPSQGDWSVEHFGD